MSNDSAIGSGGVGIQPWNSPKVGTGAGTGIESNALGPMPYQAATSQGGHSTGVGGLFAEWPGRTFVRWPGKGLFGGPGDRGVTR